MKKLMMLAAMLAMVLVAAAPAVAQTQTTEDVNLGACVQYLNQSADGDVIADNDSAQDVDQYQYAPGGEAQYSPGDDVGDVTVEDDEDPIIIIEDGPPFGNQGNSGLAEQIPVIIEGDEGDEVSDDDTTTVEGGAGGSQETDQYNEQTATATGPVLTAEQVQYCEQAIGDVVEAEAAEGEVVEAEDAAAAAAAASSGGSASAGASAGGSSSGAAQLPATGGFSLLTLGAGALLVTGGLVARRIVR